ncbi:MAG: glycosyltransferase family 87 protein [Acidimicrobiia bacterium]
MIRTFRSLESSSVTRAIFWLAMAVMAVVSLQHAVALANAISYGNGARIGLDYRAFLAAGELIRSASSDLLYEPFSPEFLELAQVGFVYPPWAALFMIPWTFLSVNVGLTLWTVVGLGVMVAGLRSCGVKDWRPAVVAMVSFPAVFALGLGQSTFFFIGIVGFTVGSMVRSQAERSGFWLALAGWKPHLLVGFGLLWVTDPRRWWRQALAAAAGTIGLILVSSIALPGSWKAWVAFLVDSVNGLASAVLEASLPGMVSLVIGSLNPVRWVIVAVLAVGLITLVIVTLRRRKASLEASIALALGTWLLIVPHVVIYDVLVLLVPLSMAFQTRFRRDVVASGTLLALGLSIGPRVIQMQLDLWGRALDLSTLALVVAVAMFAFWAWTGVPFFDEGLEVRDGSASPVRHESDVS